MAKSPLYTPQRRAVTVLYADLESYALTQHEVFAGTAGSVIQLMAALMISRVESLTIVILN